MQGFKNKDKSKWTRNMVIKRNTLSKSCGRFSSTAFAIMRSASWKNIADDAGLAIACALVRNVDDAKTEKRQGSVPAGKYT